MRNHLLNKVLYIIPCFLVFNCSQKHSNFKLPVVEQSNQNISNIQLKLDTIDKFKPISRNSIMVTNSDGRTLMYSISEGIEVTIENSEWKVLNKFTPFNKGVIGSNIVHSELISDSLVYFLYEETLWKFNTNSYQFIKVENFKLNIKTDKGTIYHNWQDCYNQTPGIVYSKLNSSLYFPIFSYSKSENLYFIGEYNIHSRRIKVLNLERPKVDEMIQRSVQDNTMYVVDSNKIYIAFGFSKMGLMFDLIHHNIDTINLSSKFDTIPQKAYTEKNTGIKSSSDRLIKTLLYNARYNYFLYNPFKHHYYKIFNKYLEEDNKESGLKNTLDDKELVLQIYDKSLSLIEEISLPSSFHYISMIMVNQGGLVLFEPTDVEFIKGNPNRMQMLNINYE